MDGECAECRRRRLTTQTRPLVQTKLTISRPDNKYEQEADRVAEQVMRMPETHLQRQVELEEEEAEQETIQIKLNRSSVGRLPSAPRRSSGRGSGVPAQRPCFPQHLQPSHIQLDQLYLHRLAFHLHAGHRYGLPPPLGPCTAGVQVEDTGAFLDEGHVRVPEDDQAKAGCGRVQIELLPVVQHVGERATSALRGRAVCGAQVDHGGNGQRSTEVTPVHVPAHGVHGSDPRELLQDLGTTHVACVQDELAPLQRLRRLRPEESVGVRDDPYAPHPVSGCRWTVPLIRLGGHHRHSQPSCSVTCSQCEGIVRFFDEGLARRELRRFRRRGPSKTTGWLLDAVADGGARERTFLDVGGGIGVVALELMSRGAAGGTHAEASPAYVSAARAEAEARGFPDRIRYLQGDFVELAADTEPADFVTLDRVVCCYPDMPALIDTAAPRARRALGLVIPRDHSLMRLVAELINFVLRVRKHPFRFFLHDPVAVEAQVERHGLDRRFRRNSFLWQVMVFTRRESRPPGGD